MALIWTVISQQDINLTAISKCRGPKSRKWAWCAKGKKLAIEVVLWAAKGRKNDKIPKRRGVQQQQWKG